MISCHNLCDDWVWFINFLNCIGPVDSDCGCSHLILSSSHSFVMLNLKLSWNCWFHESQLMFTLWQTLSHWVLKNLIKCFFGKFWNLNIWKNLICKNKIICLLIIGLKLEKLGHSPPKLLKFNKMCFIFFLAKCNFVFSSSTVTTPHREIKYKHYFSINLKWKIIITTW